MSNGDVEARYASVAVPVPVRRLFTYRVPERMKPEIEAGARVRVPFGNRKVRGTVVEWPIEPPEGEIRLREIEALLPQAPRLDPSLLRLTRFVADYYLCSWGEALEAALPPDPGPPPMRKSVRRRPGADAGLLSKRAVARKRLWESLPADGAPVALRSLTASARRAVPGAAQLGLVEVVERPEPAPRLAEAPEPTTRFELTPAQRSVLRELGPALARRAFAPFLLFGATGSGKTEVYLEAAREVLARGRGVLYLVPEIGLTPLLVSKISRRFPGAVAVLHSGLSKRERFGAWDRVRRGDCPIAVGTRSAVFAPVRDLGLIIVDEEQDGSYKQEDTPRYNGRDLALVRARSGEAVVLMGSATPSLESFHHARSGRYRLLRLGGRVERRPLPAVRIVDMRREYREGAAVRPLSRALVAALADCLGRGEQALVLRNRRGWAAAVFCPTCGHRVSCQRCSIALTWHRSERRLRCHHCDFEQPYPKECPTCGAAQLKYLGEGTERIEDELATALRGARIERLDRDTTRRRGAHGHVLRRFARGEIDVLVGTQMIAKGHDFPRVTLVGVLSADQTLALPDFRAGERTFQLLTQVAGRAGRGEQLGTVIVQAFDPSHPVIKLAATQDYEAFFEREIRYRRALRYPPLSGLVRVILEDKDELTVREWGEWLGDALRTAGQGRLLLLIGACTAPCFFVSAV